METICQGKRVTLPVEPTLASVHMRKMLTPFARANGARACSDCLALIELTLLSLSCTRRKVNLVRRVTLPSKEDDPDRRIILLS